ncbi:MobA/MobL family protein [Lentibacillus saliphilus]
MALPVELSHGQQKELIKNYAKEQFVITVRSYK